MTRISPHPCYTDKAGEAAAFYASKIEPGKHIGCLNVRARIDHRDRKPPNRGLRRVPCHGFQWQPRLQRHPAETEGCRAA